MINRDFVTNNSSLIWLYIVAISASALAGVLLVSNNVMVLAPFIGGFIAIFLLRNLELTTGLVIFFSLFVVGLVQLHIPSLQKIVWAVALLSILLIPFSLFKRANLVDVQLDLTLRLALFFIFYSVIVSVLNISHPIEFIMGLRRLIQAWGIFFVAGLIVLTPRSEKLMYRMLAVLAAIQLPLCLYQLKILVPIREGMTTLGIVPIDVVSGSFGASLTGGGSSSEMAAFIIIGLGFVISLYRASFISGRNFLLLLIVLLLPHLMGEVKIIILYLPVMFLFVYADLLKKNFFQFVIVFLVVTAFLFLAGYLYFEFLAKNNFYVEMKNIEAYNVGSVGYGSYYLNRLSVLTFWFDEHIRGDWFHLFLGHGLGSSNDAASGLVIGSIAEKYPNYGIGLTTASALLWDVGLFGFLLFLGLFSCAWQASRKMESPFRFSDGRDALKNPIRAGLMICFLSLFYSASLVDRLPFQMIFSLLIALPIYYSRPHTKLKLMPLKNEN